MNVFITKNIPQAGIVLLQEKGINLTINPTENILSREEFIKICKENDVLLNVGANNLDEDFFQQCPNLKGIALFSVGFDAVHMPSANSRKIPVGNTPDVLSRATSDIAFLLMQSVARKSFYNHKKIINGKWEGFNALENLGQELYGKTLGIFGLGRIGFEMAQKCKAAFGMKIIYHNRSHNENAEKELDAQYVDFETLLSQSDVLSVHSNYSEENNELFNKDTFAKMLAVFGIVFEEEVLDADIEALIAKRQEARANRDFATADAIRDQLAAQGIKLLDTKDGVRWTRD